MASAGPWLLNARDQESRRDGKPKGWDMVSAGEAWGGSRPEPIEQETERGQEGLAKTSGTPRWRKAQFSLPSEGSPEEFLPFPESLHC